MKVCIAILSLICAIIAFVVLYKLYERFEKAHDQENIADMIRYMLYILVWSIIIFR